RVRRPRGSRRDPDRGRRGARGPARRAARRPDAERDDRRARGAADASPLGPSGGHGPGRRPDPADGAADVRSGRGAPGPGQYRSGPDRQVGSLPRRRPRLAVAHRTCAETRSRRLAMSADEKFENAKDKLGGQAKEGLGKVTDDKETEAEGKAQQGRADAKDKLEDARDTVKGAAQGMFGD